jgi:hypothetical protein
MQGSASFLSFFSSRFALSYAGCRSVFFLSIRHGFASATTMTVTPFMNRKLIIPEPCLHSALFLYLPPRRLDRIRVPKRISKPTDFHPTFDPNQKSGDLIDNPSYVHQLEHDHGYNHDHKLDLTNLDPEIPDCIFNPNPGPDFYSSSNSYLGRLPSRSSSISPQASVSNSVTNSALGLSLSSRPDLQRSCPSPCHCHHRHHRHSLQCDGSSSPAENKNDYSYKYDYDDSDAAHKRGLDGGIRVSDRT